MQASQEMTGVACACPGAARCPGPPVEVGLPASLLALAGGASLCMVKKPFGKQH